MNGRSRLHIVSDPAKPEEHSAGLLPGRQHPSFTNLCNGRANDGKAASTSESSNLDTANTIASAVGPW